MPLRMMHFHETLLINLIRRNVPVSAPEISRNQPSAHHGSIAGLNRQMHWQGHFLYIPGAVAASGIQHHHVHEVVFRKSIPGMTEPGRDLGYHVRIGLTNY